jgi:transcriptional regulator with XRE-family HTH domain
MSQADFAKEMGVDRAVISRYCSYKKTPSKRTALKIVAYSAGDINFEELYIQKESK